MEEIKKEIIVGYKSFDGHTFDSADECTKYEKSCIGVVKSKLLPYVAQKLSEDVFLLGYSGSSDYSVYTIPVVDESIKDTLIQFRLIKARVDVEKDPVIKSIQRAYANKETIILYKSEYDSEEWISENTLEQYIEHLNSLKKPKDNADSNSNTVQ